MYINRQVFPSGNNQKGIAHLFLIVILVAGVALAVYLVQQKTNILPFANEPPPCPISGPCPTVAPTPSSTPKPRMLQTDFNGDGKSDLTVFRTSNNTWYVKNVFNLPWGRADKRDIPVPGDYNGDGKADLAVYNPNTAEWSVQTGQQRKDQEMYVNWGDYEKNEIPVQADYNGDGVTDFAVWTPESGTWYVNYNLKKNSAPSAGFETGGSGQTTTGGIGVSTNQRFKKLSGEGNVGNLSDTVLKVQWGRGSDGDIPVPGDYDGDGKADFAVYHPSDQPNQSFYYIKYANGKEEKINIGLWDGTSVIPVAADYDGDGKTNPAVWDSAGGEWKVYGQSSISWGKAGNIPVVGDYNGDGKSDYAVWDPSNGFWYVKNVTEVSWGRSDRGDIPLPKNPSK